MRNSTKVLGIALVVALLLGVMALPAVGQASRTRLNWLIADKLTVGSDGMTNTITITDTGTLKLSGNAALGQYDTITLWSDGTNWIEISETNN